MKQILVTFDGRGGSVIETQGFDGPACLEATRKLKDALGVETAQEPTAEMDAAHAAHAVEARARG